jgi:hypothetical protein
MRIVCDRCSEEEAWEEYIGDEYARRRDGGKVQERRGERVK